MEHTFFHDLQKKKCNISVDFVNGQNLNGSFMSFDEGNIYIESLTGHSEVISSDQLDDINKISFKASSSIKKGNPFAHVARAGGISGDLFVGRKNETDFLWDRAVLNKSFTQIVGLPKMGKTSLVKECLTSKKEQLLKEYKTLYIYYEIIDISVLSFWQQLLETLASSLSNITASRKKQRIIKEYQREIKKIVKQTNVVFLHNTLCRLLKSIQKELGFTVLYALDEFDYLIKMKDYDKEVSSCFEKLKQLASICTIVTISRRPLKIIEQKVSGSADLYTLAPNPIYVGVFSSEDIDAYWKRCEHLLPLNQEQLDDYKQMVHRYVGSHPCLMDTLNHNAFRKLYRINEEKESIERNLRIQLQEEIKYQMDYVADQELEDSARTLLIGADADGLQDDATLLTNYSFLNYIPSTRKEQLFGGSQVGPRFEMGQMAYTCFSEFATVLFYNMYTERLSYADKLYRAEMQLRELIKNYLIVTQGNNCFDIIIDGIDENYTERWENTMKDKAYATIDAYFPFHKRQRMKDNWDNTLLAVKIARKNQLNFEIGFSPITRHLVDFASLGQIQNLFLNKDWSWFRNIFMENNIHVWMNSVFEKILKLRNSKDHFQMDFIVQSQLDDCINACDEFIEKVDAYLMSIE